MPEPEPDLSDSKAIIVLLLLASVALGWVIWPLSSAVFWAVIFAIVLDPLYRRVLVWTGGRKGLASFGMVIGILLLLIIPMLSILAAIVSEVAGLFARVTSGEINLQLMFQQIMQILPNWLTGLLQRLGLGNLGAVQDGIALSVGEWVGANTPQVLAFGQNTAGIFVSLGVMLYLVFYLFRDGDRLVVLIKSAVPLRRALRETLLGTFTTAVGATVRGDILVALLQGGLGGIGLWVLGVHAALLWTVLMTFASLFPVFGAALVWMPIAVYFLANGMVWQGVALITYGVVVIGLIDNIARPLLVGQATRLPSYVVLISTIGGIATFGLQGFITGPVIAAMFVAVWSTYLALDMD